MVNLSNINGMLINKNVGATGKIMYYRDGSVFALDGDAPNDDDGKWWKLEPVEGHIDIYYLMCPSNGDSICCDQEGEQLYAGCIDLNSPNRFYWEVVPISGQPGTYQLISAYTGKAIYCPDPKNQRISVGTPDQNNMDQWWMIIPELDWEVEFVKIDYDENVIDNFVGTPDMWYQEDVLNSSEATITTHFAKTLTRSSTFEFSFTETLSASVSASFTATIPLIASTNVTVTIGMGLSANQRWEKTISEEYSVSKDIEYPPRSKTRVQCITDFVDNVKVPFEIEVRVAAKYKNGTLLKDDELKTYLSATGFDGIIIDSGPNELWASIKGVLFGSWGIRSRIIAVPLTY